MTGSAKGNLSVSTIHVTNGVHGEVDDHENILNWHATGTIATNQAGGTYTDAATSHHGMDAIIAKLSDAGVLESIYAADAIPADGLLAGSVNGLRGGGGIGLGVVPFADGRHAACFGIFRGNITFPIGNAGATTTLTHRELGAWEGWVLKLDTWTMQGVWAVALQTPDADPASCDYVRCSLMISGVEPLAKGHVIVTSFRSKRIIRKLDGADGSTIWEKDWTLEGVVHLGDPASVGEHSFVGGIIAGGVNGTDPFGTGLITSLPSPAPAGHTKFGQKGFLTKVRCCPCILISQQASIPHLTPNLRLPVHTNARLILPASPCGLSPTWPRGLIRWPQRLTACMSTSLAV